MSILTSLAFLIKELIIFIGYIKNNTFPQPLSEEEEEKQLKKMANGDILARNVLIEHNLRLVAHIVKKYENAKEESDDLISIGTIGLIKGIESFQKEKGTKLATYAARCIENEILMYLRTLKKKRKDISLYDPIGTDKEGNEISLIDILGTDSNDVLDKVENSIDKNLIYKYLHVLDEREKEVIIKRFGLDDGVEKMQREIAKQLDISRSYVSRIEKRALLKLLSEFKKNKATK